MLYILTMLRLPSSRLLLVAILVACTPTSEQIWGVPVAEACVGRPEPLLMPPNTFPTAPWEENDLRSRQLNSRLLVEMGEPSLWCGMSADTEAYRFVLIQTSGPPLAVRISKEGNAYTLNAVVLSGTGVTQDEPRQVVRRIVRPLTRAEWDAIVAALEDINFSTMTTEMDDLVGADGGTWTIEARREGRYHLAQRWEGNGGMRQVGRAFLTLGGLEE